MPQSVQYWTALWHLYIRREFYLFVLIGRVFPEPLIKGQAISKVHFFVSVRLQIKNINIKQEIYP